MRTARKILDTWDGAGTGIKFRIVQIVETRVEVLHPEIDWTPLSEESQQQILAKRGFTFE